MVPQRTIQSKNISFLPFYNTKNLLSTQRGFCDTERLLTICYIPESQITYQTHQLWCTSGFCFGPAPLHLRFNSNKTDVILIGSKAVVSKHSSQLMDLDGDLIMPSTKVSNLGALIDSTLSFNDHIGKVSPSGILSLLSFKNLLKNFFSLSITPQFTVCE